MNEWYSLIQQIAIQRIDDIERHLMSHPDEYPQYFEVARALHEAMDAHMDDALNDRDNLWIAYLAVQALEFYLAGARDGGRMYHALTTGELPSIQKQENSMNRMTPEKLANLRARYPEGSRVKLLCMRDPYMGKLTVGALGTVQHVDDIGTIHVAWDCGSSLGVAYGEDFCTVISEEDAHD